MLKKKLDYYSTGYGNGSLISTVKRKKINCVTIPSGH